MISNDEPAIFLFTAYYFRVIYLQKPLWEMRLRCNTTLDKKVSELIIRYHKYSDRGTNFPG